MPKRKSRRPAKANRPFDGIDLIDEAVGACRAIEMLAQLLNLAGASGVINATLAAETGWLIDQHAQRLHQTLRVIEEGIAR